MPVITLAVIDIGTNSVKTTIAQKEGSKPMQTLCDTTTITKLGRDVDASGKLDAETMQHTLDAIAIGAQQAKEARALRIAAVGTSALRDATNSGDFVNSVEKLLGSNGTFEILSGMREAKLIFNAARRDTDLKLPPHNPSVAMPTVIAALDIGGGSVEIVLGYGEAVTFQESLQMGAVRLTERAFTDNPPTSEQLGDAILMADEAMKEIPSPKSEDLAPQVNLVGSGGTIVNLIRMEAFRSIPADQPGEIAVERLHGARLTRGKIEDWVDKLATMTTEEISQIRGLEPARADSILAGAILQARAMRRLGTDTVIVSVRGLRYGLLYELFDIEW